jgi:hypothetical protein
LVYVTVKLWLLEGRTKAGVFWNRVLRKIFVLERK